MFGKFRIMKKALLITFLLLCSVLSRSQVRFGAYVAGGITTSSVQDVTPSFGIECMKAVDRNVYAGLSMICERYSIISNYSKESAYTMGFHRTREQKSTYLFVAPKIDGGIGQNKQRIHLLLSLGVGYLLGGSQLTIDQGSLVASKNARYSLDTFNTSGNINKMVFRMGMGVSEHLGLSRNWELVFTQEAGLLPSVAKYFSFQVGLMHKYVRKVAGKNAAAK